MSTGSSHAAGERAALAALHRPLTKREKAETFGPPYYRVRVMVHCAADIVLSASQRQDAAAIAKLILNGQLRFMAPDFELAACEIGQATAVEVR